MRLCDGSNLAHECGADRVQSSRRLDKNDWLARVGRARSARVGRRAPEPSREGSCRVISCVACLRRCRVMGCCASHDLAAPEPGRHNSLQPQTRGGQARSIWAGGPCCPHSTTGAAELPDGLALLAQHRIPSLQNRTRRLLRSGGTSGAPLSGCPIWAVAVGAAEVGRYQHRRRRKSEELP